MKRYVALLRGVSPMNAKMTDLKACFEKMGFKDVKTVLASGNVIFSAPTGSTSSLEKKIEAALKKCLDHDFPTIVRSVTQIEDIIASNPFQSVKITPSTKRVVTFLKELPKSKVKLPIELEGARILKIIGTEVYTAYVPSPKGAVFMKLIEKTFGKEVTTRSLETVQKLVR